MVDYPTQRDKRTLSQVTTMMRAEQKAAVSTEVRRRQAEDAALDLEAQLARVRGGKLTLRESRDLTDVSAIMINEGAEILRDLALHAPDLHVRALCADRLTQRGIEIYTAIANARPERDAAGPQRVVVVREQDMDAIERSLTAELP